LALILGQMERYPEALEAFKRGGDEANAYYRIGCVYLSKGKHRKAIEAFEKAVELKPGFYVKAQEKMRQAKEAIQNTSQPN